ncbi:nicotinate-nucleotide adenylyltransferase [uncultured Massilia sp.]|uniref:nicotinate-nucleotide adenylyltransferase n=1 Tax=uncultured Massilia sp. TaxID=169973 RepID=UPI0025FD42F4|nr:nicotinate-nucleotide adenylyltransferase [uncultured Massilia sp.]
MTRCIALLGGSFDPVHHGHVALAALFARLLAPAELRVLPAGQPWQKAGGLRAPDADRVRMLALAFAAGAVPVTIDTREIDRHAPTYTVETLRELRAECGPDASLVFLMGADQLQKLDTWHDWQALFGLANFGVAARPGYRLDDAALPPAVARELAARRATPEQVRASPAGRVCLAHTLAVDISATQVRAALQHAGTSGQAGGVDVGALLAPQVLDYIQQHNLYKI